MQRAAEFRPWGQWGSRSQRRDFAETGGWAEMINFLWTRPLHSPDSYLFSGAVQEQLGQCMHERKMVVGDKLKGASTISSAGLVKQQRPTAPVRHKVCIKSGTIPRNSGGEACTEGPTGRYDRSEWPVHKWFRSVLRRQPKRQRDATTMLKPRLCWRLAGRHDRGHSSRSSLSLFKY